MNDQIISLIDVTATTLDLAGIAKPPLMQGRIFLGAHAEPPRKYAFAARDRIDETVQRIRSVHDERYHYIRTFTDGPDVCLAESLQGEVLPDPAADARAAGAGQAHRPAARADGAPRALRGTLRHADRSARDADLVTSTEARNIARPCCACARRSTPG